MDFFRLAWDLTDAAAFVDVLRSPHDANADPGKALDGLRSCIAIRRDWEELL